MLWKMKCYEKCTVKERRWTNLSPSPHLHAASFHTHSTQWIDRTHSQGTVAGFAPRVNWSEWETVWREYSLTAPVCIASNCCPLMFTRWTRFKCQYKAHNDLMCLPLWHLVTLCVHCTYESVLSSLLPVEPMISPNVQNIWPRKSFTEEASTQLMLHNAIQL